MKSTGFSRYAGTTFLIGAGFFTMGLMDPLYDTYVPTFLGRHLSSMALIGGLMTLDNILAILLIPIVTVWSDGTRTRMGRRMPFILVTLPLSALFFSLLPFAAPSLLGILLVVFLLNIFKQAARGPVVALMPDVIPGSYRSEANGVINTMGGIAAIVGTIGLARLMDLDVTLPLLGPAKGRLPFPIAGLLVIVALAVLVGVSLALFAFDAALRRGVLPNALGLPSYLAILFVFGVFWSAVVTNSFPMLWQMATPETMGVYTGLYYTFSQLAAVLAPPIAGGIIDLIRIGSAGGSRLADIPASVGYPGMFLFCAAGMLGAFIVMRFVHHGEPGDEKAA